MSIPGDTRSPLGTPLPSQLHPHAWVANLQITSVHMAGESRHIHLRKAQLLVRTLWKDELPTLELKKGKRGFSGRQDNFVSWLLSSVTCFFFSALKYLLRLTNKFVASTPNTWPLLRSSRQLSCCMCNHLWVLTSGCQVNEQHWGLVKFPKQIWWNFSKVKDNK